MDEADWYAGVSSVLKEARENGSDPDKQRQFLFGLWSLFTKAPSTIHREFIDISDEEISMNSFIISEQLGSSVQSEYMLDLNRHSPVLLAASLLRGLESAWVSSGSVMQEPRNASDLLVKHGPNYGYVVPISPYFRSAPPTSRYFAKRGLLRTRCISGIVANGLKVELAVFRPTDSVKNITCRGYVFESAIPMSSDGSELDWNASTDFVFHGLNRTPSDFLESDLRQSITSNNPSDIIVYPELSILPSDREKLIHLLQSKPWDPQLELKSPILVVGGSWHDRDGDVFVNRSPIYTGDGKFLGFHTKHIPFTDSKAGLKEDIFPSNSILVVCTSGLLIAIGICLDFCQAAQLPNPYDELDVDLILVPSWGADSTLRSHRDAAKRLWDNRKTATFVAQQHECKAYGYVGATGGARKSLFKRVNARSMNVVLPAAR